MRELALSASRGTSPAIIEARVSPELGMNIVSARAWTPRLGEFELLDPLGPSARFPFEAGAAFLIPFANRMRGIAGERVLLHGFVYAMPVNARLKAPSVARGSLLAGNFGGRWPGNLELAFEVNLESGGLRVKVRAINRGNNALPVGVGWHPYLRIPSGERKRASVRLRAEGVLEVDSERLPTGRVLAPPPELRDGLELSGRGLDDCFVRIERDASGVACAELLDLASETGIRVSTRSPHVRGFQIYAPKDKAVVALEPQFNWTDGLNRSVWPADLIESGDTGMVFLNPNAEVEYEARIDVYALY